jgi:uncharacterized protein
MKLHLADAQGRFGITGHGPGHVLVNGERHEQALIVTPDQVLRWPVTCMDTLRPDDLALLVAQAADIVLIGTGERQLFPRPAVLRPLIEAGRGFEVMTTAAACRTYNILLNEGRRVAAALLIP